jgi:hypothetical protein
VLCLGCHLFASKGTYSQSALILGDTATTEQTLWIDGLSFPTIGTSYVFGNSAAPYPDPSFVPTLSNQATTTTVVLQDIDDFTYMNQPASGTSSDVYLESVAFGPFIFVNQRAWVRNFDPETAVFMSDNQFIECYGLMPTAQSHIYGEQGNSHIVASGSSAQLWALGLKTENREMAGRYPAVQGCPADPASLPAIPIIEADSGAKVEILSSTSFVFGREDHAAAMLVKDASISVEGLNIYELLDKYDYDMTVDQSYGAVQSIVYKAKGCQQGEQCSYAGPHGSVIPLYIGY